MEDAVAITENKGSGEIWILIGRYGPQARSHYRNQIAAASRHHTDVAFTPCGAGGVASILHRRDLTPDYQSIECISSSRGQWRGITVL